MILKKILLNLFYIFIIIITFGSLYIWGLNQYKQSIYYENLNSNLISEKKQ